MDNEENAEVNKKQVEPEVVEEVVVMKQVLMDLEHKLYAEEVEVLPHTEVKSKKN
jgi:hypothetical protein